MQIAFSLLIVAFVLTGCPAAPFLIGVGQGMNQERMRSSWLLREQAEADYLKGVVEIEKQRLELERKRLELEKERTKPTSPPIDPFPASRTPAPPSTAL